MTRLAEAALDVETSADGRFVATLPGAVDRTLEIVSVVDATEAARWVALLRAELAGPSDR
jgi:hypothetical protein